MPIPATADLPPPRDEDEFENMVADALRLRFQDPRLVRVGRRGQPQGGIDGGDMTAPRDRSPVWQATLGQEVEKKIARDLATVDADPRGQPSLFVVALGRKRDATLTLHFEELSCARLKENKCPLLVLFWEDIRDNLCQDVAVARKWYPTLYPSENRGSTADLQADDLLVLAALAEHRDEHGDDPDPWATALLGLELEIRTGLASRKINDAEEILRSRGLVEARPFGPGEKGGSPFKFHRLLMKAAGERALGAAPTRPELPGPRLPPAVEVAPNFPETFPPDGERLLFAEQRRGFKLAWEDQLRLPSLLKSGPELVTVEIGGRMVRLHTRHGSRVWVLVRSPLREPTEDEASALVKEYDVGFTYLRKEGSDWIVRNQTPVASPLGGPPSSILTSELARRKTLLEVLADLRMPFPGD